MEGKPNSQFNEPVNPQIIDRQIKGIQAAINRLQASVRSTLKSNSSARSVDGGNQVSKKN